MKPRLLITKRLIAFVFLSALFGLTGLAVDGTYNVAAAQLVEADCRACHDETYISRGLEVTNTSEVHHRLQRSTVPPMACNVCHTGIPGTEQTSPLDCLVCHSASGHAAQHDMTNVDSPDCAECHNANVVTEHVDNQALTCGTCHDSTVPEVQAAITSGMAGNPVLCLECHGPTDHTLAHDMTDVDSPDCAACHDANVVTEHIDNQGLICATCHSNTSPTVQAAIASGMAGNTVVCSECHGQTDHLNAHNMATVPSPGCTKCHDTNVVTEHVTNRGLSCETCHSSTDQMVQDTIALGMAGTQVFCGDCHLQNNHHATDEAAAGNCTYCHADPRVASLGTGNVPSDATVPTGQLACRQCHGTNMHNKISASSSATIQDYGACFACHQPVPYHAKPTGWPGWYEENAEITGNATGRGSFNLFYNELRPSCAPNCEDEYENRPGYDEDGQPARDAGRNWQSPKIDFQWITFFDFFNTNQSWTVPTFGDVPPGDGGGTPPGGGNDSVTITRADYNDSDEELRVYATNTLGDTVYMSVNYDGRDYDMYWDSSDDRWEVRINSRNCNDSTIEVTSSAGGSATSSVDGCSSYGGDSSSSGSWGSWGH